MTRTLRFPYIPPGANRLHNMHFRAVSAMRKQIHDDMALLLAGEPRQPVERALLSLDFRWRTKARRDPDNYLAGAKALIDSLIGYWLVDDDTEHLVLTAMGQVGTGEPDHVILRLEADR